VALKQPSGISGGSRNNLKFVQTKVDTPFFLCVNYNNSNVRDLNLLVIGEQ